MDDFDFSFQRSAKQDEIRRLAQLDFLREKKNVIFLGPPGTGKPTFPSRSGCRPPAEATGCSSPPPRSGWPASARPKRQGRLDEELERLGRIPLLIVDEGGYIPFDPEAVIFRDPVAVAALADWLVHHADVIVMRGESYRLKGRGRELMQAEQGD